MRFDRYVGLPWLDRGRTCDGVDCWGLLRLVYAGELGIELPSFATDYADTSDRGRINVLVAEERDPWVPVERGREQPCDVVLIRERPWHVGAVVRRGLMLHIEQDRSSVIEPYTTMRHAARVEGIYRHISRCA
ncbi:MAG: NlpC/P60 family protein [Pararhizobium sp.]